MPTVLKRILQTIAALIVLALIVVGGYVAYMQLNYYRIADNTALQIENNQTLTLERGTSYTAVTYNIGFGAYTPDFTFFMDTGYMADGTPTQGERGTAESEASVRACTEGDIQLIANLNCDFALLQEVDENATRSYGVNQRDLITQAFPNMAATFANNFHSPFLAYPFHDMHGSVQAGLLTLSRAHIDSAIRRSYPVDQSFITKFTDLDRCFSVLRIPVQGGRELVLINSHMSAYDEGGMIRAQQLEMLNEVLADEAAAGNYVVVGGDWNHALGGSESMYPSEQLVPDWLAVFDDSLLTDGYRVVIAENIAEVPTCRDVDITWQPGVTYCSTVDGFIVSDNVIARAENVDNGFLYSDHNPVKLTFELV